MYFIINEYNIVNMIFFITLIMHKILYSLISTSHNIILLLSSYTNILFFTHCNILSPFSPCVVMFPLSMCTHISHNTVVNLLPCVSNPQALTTRVHSLSTERARVDPIELGHLLCAEEHLVQDTSVVGFTSA